MKCYAQNINGKWQVKREVEAENSYYGKGRAMLFKSKKAAQNFIKYCER